MLQSLNPLMRCWLILPGLLLSASCSVGPLENAQSQPPRTEPEQAQLPLVEVAVVASRDASNALDYIGTTSPLQTVALRSRVEGQLLSLTADVGDSIHRGKILAQLDRDLLLKEVGETRAELAARQFEVEQAKSQLAEAHTQVEQAKAQLQQAKADAERLHQLVNVGAISRQDAEAAQTNFRTTEQVLKSAQEQVKTRERAIASIQQRVAVQSAIVEQVSQQLTYATLTSPLTGVVLSRAVEPGDLVQPGQILLEIGDLSAIHVDIQVSDRDLSQFTLGQTVQVSLDAFPQETFMGSITQISPVAGVSSRLIPVQVTIPNPGSKIGSGLLARVSLTTAARPSLTIPESALTLGQGGNNEIVFVPLGPDVEVTIESRVVQVGQRDNGHVEILSGLQWGDPLVVKSDRPLKAGQVVRRSFLSD